VEHVPASPPQPRPHACHAQSADLEGFFGHRFFWLISDRREYETEQPTGAFNQVRRSMACLEMAQRAANAGTSQE